MKLYKGTHTGTMHIVGGAEQETNCSLVHLQSRAVQSYQAHTETTLRIPSHRDPLTFHSLMQNDDKRVETIKFVGGEDGGFSLLY